MSNTLSTPLAFPKPISLIASTGPCVIDGPRGYPRTAVYLIAKYRLAVMLH